MAKRPACVQEGVDLKPLNTLAIAARATYFARVSDTDSLREVLAWQRAASLPLLLLGGGSNVVLRGDWHGLVLQYGDNTVSLHECDGDDVLVRAGAGVVWHDLVCYCSAQGWHGLENLALIPGSVGAAPVQNIGAYGVELDSLVDSVDVVDLANGVTAQLSREQCQFGYRDSVFKSRAAGQYLITAVTLRLSSQFCPVLSYPALRDALPCENPTPQQVIDTVVAVRQSKLPDPAKLPNAGSFFKNPVVPAQQAAQLLEQYPVMPHYPAAAGQQKLAAAWLIDRAGWRGKALGPVAMHDKQALVLTNPAGGSGAQVLALAERVAQDVLAQFGVALEIEPQCVGGDHG